MARKFLYLVAIAIVLVLAAGLAYTLFPGPIMRLALVPGSEFKALPPLKPGDYQDKRLWIARPDIPDNPARWTPPGAKPADAPKVAIFYIHPTSYLDRSAWNAPLDDKAANDRAVLFLRGQATAFNGIGDIWAPHYRQATFGAFLTDRAAAEQALSLAYRDVIAAFDEFLREAGPHRPIVLVGHSQGALHLMHLLRDRVAGTPLAQRIIAAYVVGWPISREADLPEMGLQECARPDQTGCLLSWQSFAEPADPSQVKALFEATAGLTGGARGGTHIICTNPLTGTADASAPASANIGTLVPSADLSSGVLVPGKVPARCNADGFLLIGPPPEGFGSYVLPGNNYHVFDFTLFWSNIRADVARRAHAFGVK